MTLTRTSLIPVPPSRALCGVTLSLLQVALAWIFSHPVALGGGQHRIQVILKVLGRSSTGGAAATSRGPEVGSDTDSSPKASITIRSYPKQFVFLVWIRCTLVQPGF